MSLERERASKGHGNSSFTLFAPAALCGSLSVALSDPPGARVRASSWTSIGRWTAEEGAFGLEVVAVGSWRSVAAACCGDDAARRVTKKMRVVPSLSPPSPLFCSTACGARLESGTCARVWSGRRYLVDYGAGPRSLSSVWHSFHRAIFATY